MKNNKNAKTNDMIFGGLSIVFAVIAAGIMLAAGIINFVVSIGTGWVSRIFGIGIVGNSIAGQLVFFSLVLLCTWITIGIKALLRMERCKRYENIFAAYPRLKFIEVVKGMNRSLKYVSSDLHVMKKRGYFKEMNFDLDNKELVFSTYTAPLPKIAGEADTVYKGHKGSPVIPYVAAALTFVSFSFVLPLLPAVLFAVGAFLLTLKFFPTPIYFTEEVRTAPQVNKPSVTGNNELDGALGSIFENKKELVRLSTAINSQKIREPLQEILRVLDAITAYVTDNPAKVKSLRQFVNYYLPTTVNFLHTYEELELKLDKGENITATLRKIEEVTANLTAVYKREYDDLFSDKVMDIEAEAAVMKALMKESESLI